MENLGHLLNGFAIVLTPRLLLCSFIGVTLGTLVGIFPGIGPALTIALLLPVAYSVEPTAAFVVFGGIYYGAAYGSSTSAILVNTPGEASSVATTIDGYQMARRGRAGAALATAAIGSFVAGTIGTVALTLVAPLFASLALVFGPADYFALMCLACLSVSALFGRSILLGLVSLFFGLALGVVGIDTQSTYPRYSFGVVELLDGIDITTAVVGMLAVGEVFWLAWVGGAIVADRKAVVGSIWMSREDWRRSFMPWIRGSVIGFPIGALPAGGAEVPTLLSYMVEKKLSKHPEEFGQGAIEGVAGPEAANNASSAGVLVPLLTFGLPTSATAAVMLAAFQAYGVQPGPFLFQSNQDLVWAIIASLYVGNFFLLVLNLPLVGLWVRLLTIPPPYLYSGVLFFALFGIFAASNSVFQILLAIVLGIVAFGFRYFGIPITPAILGLVLGPLAEVQLRRALQISQGDWSVFVTRPISGGIILLMAALLLLIFTRSRKLVLAHVD